MKAETNPINKLATKYLITGQIIFFSFIGVCFLINQGAILADTGISYYSGRLSTILPYVMALLGMSWALYKIAMLMPKEAPHRFRYWFLGLSILGVGLVLSPADTGSITEFFHFIFSRVIIGVEGFMILWIVLEVKHDFKQIALFVLSLIMIGWMILAVMGLGVGYLTIAELVFQFILTFVWYRSLTSISFDGISEPRRAAKTRNGMINNNIRIKAGMIRKRLYQNQRGDTIVEVLIALAILGLAFGISYATANHALQVSQNAQEHSQALQLIDSQVELVRTYVNNNALFVNGATYCLKNDGTIVSLPNPSCTKTIGGAKYSYKIDYSAAPNSDSVPQDIFTFTIKWPGIGNLGPQQEQLSYKIHQP